MQRSVGLRTVALLLRRDPRALDHNVMNLTADDVNSNQPNDLPDGEDWTEAGAKFVAQICFIWEVLSEGIGEMNQGCRTTFAFGLQALHGFLLPYPDCVERVEDGAEYSHIGHMVEPRPLLDHLEIKLRISGTDTAASKTRSDHPKGEKDKQTTSVSAKRQLFVFDGQSHATVCLSVSENARKILISRLVWAVTVYSEEVIRRPAAAQDAQDVQDQASTDEKKNKTTRPDTEMSTLALRCLLRIGMHSEESATDVASASGLIPILMEKYVLHLSAFSESTTVDQGYYRCASLAVKLLHLCCSANKKVAVQLKREVCVCSLSELYSICFCFCDPVVTYNCLQCL